MIDTNELRRLAQAATSGEWYVKRGNHIYGRIEVTDGEEKWHPVIACTDDDETNVAFEANAAFIAAANPTGISALLDRLEAAEKERDAAELMSLALRAKVEQMERQEPVGTTHAMPGASAFTMACFNASDVPVGTKLYTLPGAQPAQSVPDGWLRAIDEAIIVAHIGVANESDTYEQAKAKLDNLIGFHVDVATDPAVNGGWKLVPIEPSIPEISDDLIEVIESRAEQSYRRHHGGIRGQQVTPADALSWHIIHATRDVLATAAPEAKP